MSAATRLANLEARRTAVTAELAALDTTKAGGLPNTDGVGVNVDHTDYKRSLYEELERLEKLIDEAEDDVARSAGNYGYQRIQHY